MSDQETSDLDDVLGGDDWAEALAEQDAKDQATDQQSAAGGEAAAQAADPEADIRTAELEDFSDSPQPEEPEDEDINLDVILDIPVTLSMEIGRTKISIRNLLQLNQGSVVELDRLAGEALDVMVNGTLVAHGEVVVVNERFGIRLTDVVSPAERVKKLR